MKENVPSKTVEKPAYAIVIHGGAGYIQANNFSDENKEKYLNALDTALTIGETILKDGGSSIEAVEKTINYMENNPLFNAGKGAVFTHDGQNEMDASIMYGKDQNAGAVGGVRTVKNPISLARKVMEESDHVMMVGKGAEQFGMTQNIEMVDTTYFFVQDRWNALQNMLKSEEEKEKTRLSEDPIDTKHGTVGCVALDKDGNLCAGTSTGGMTNKKYDRVGDSPIIGAGTFADNATCGVSCTGHGEYFIRYTVARDVAALMEYGNYTLAEAADIIVNDKLKEKGGNGGLIAIDKDGNIAMPFNTSSMFRGYVTPDQKEIEIFK